MITGAKILQRKIVVEIQTTNRQTANSHVIPRYMADVTHQRGESSTWYYFRPKFTTEIFQKKLLTFLNLLSIGLHIPTQAVGQDFLLNSIISYQLEINPITSKYPAFNYYLVEYSNLL